MENKKPDLRDLSHSTVEHVLTVAPGRERITRPALNPEQSTDLFQTGSEKSPQPSYELEFTDDEDETPEGFPRNVYYFYQCEQVVVQGISEIIRKKLLLRAGISPRQIAQIGKFLFGLERLPLLTSEFSMVVSLVFRLNHECSYREIGLTSDSFRLVQGGVAYDEAVGSDSFSSTTVEVGFGWRGDQPSWMDIAEWVASFGHLALDEDYALEIGDYGDDIDWASADSDDVDALWSELPDVDYSF